MKRFYKQVSVEGQEGQWQILLDGRAVKTAGGRRQVLPTQAMADALAHEWAEQGENIDPGRFVLRDLADYTIDIVAPGRDTAILSVLPYAETDTLCYRADEGEALHARQIEVWEPLLQAAEQRWDVHFVRVSGIVHHAQPEATLARMAAVLAARDDATLAALHTLASLAASLVLALAAVEPHADAEALWQAANLEEDWQADLWGKDAEAQARRARRFATFAAAMRFAALSSGSNAPGNP
ncbi:MAG: ATP12 family protein [Novosphingobium sp.]